MKLSASSTHACRGHQRARLPRVHQAELSEARQPHEHAVRLDALHHRVVDGAHFRRLVALRPRTAAAAAAAAPVTSSHPAALSPSS